MLREARLRCAYKNQTPARPAMMQPVIHRVNIHTPIFEKKKKNLQVTAHHHCCCLPFLPTATRQMSSFCRCKAPQRCGGMLQRLVSVVLHCNCHSLTKPNQEQSNHSCTASSESFGQDSNDERKSGCLYLLKGLCVTHDLSIALTSTLASTNKRQTATWSSLAEHCKAVSS